MSRRVVLIRAVNVGGAKLPMAELREIAESLGAADVSTYIASGNLICTPPVDTDAFDRVLEKAIEDRFGYFREVVSRSADDLRRALDAHPFEVVEARFSYVYALTGIPLPEAVEAFESHGWEHEDVKVIGQDLHIRYREGAAQSKLTAPRIAKMLGVQGTGRNLTTVNKLIELAE
ncbi:MAG: DUF1697 domain-containing protein [Actinomycetales bacterium]|nr:MAG: DUF1697 domain-containing protein [Actinomycetales bacterium]